MSVIIIIIPISRFLRGSISFDHLFGGDTTTLRVNVYKNILCLLLFIVFVVVFSCLPQIPDITVFISGLFSLQVVLAMNGIYLGICATV